MSHDPQRIPSEVVYSPRLLDALREHIHRWSVGLHDPGSGGFRCNDAIGPNVMSATGIVYMRYACGDPDVGAPDRSGIVRFLQAKQDRATGKVCHDPGRPGKGTATGMRSGRLSGR